MNTEFTIQDVFKAFGKDYLQNHKLSFEEKKYIMPSLTVKQKNWDIIQ